MKVGWSWMIILFFISKNKWDVFVESGMIIDTKRCRVTSPSGELVVQCSSLVPTKRCTNHLSRRQGDGCRAAGGEPQIPSRPRTKPIIFWKNDRCTAGNSAVPNPHLTAADFHPGSPFSAVGVPAISRSPRNGWYLRPKESRGWHGRFSTSDVRRFSCGSHLSWSACGCNMARWRPPVVRIRCALQSQGEHTNNKP